MSSEENKQRLLIDLCARLPYGVNVDIKYSTENGSSLRAEVCSEGMLKLNTDVLGLFQEEEIYLKPYLRPMSSMTEEEKTEVQMFIDIVADENYGDSYSPSAWDAMNGFMQYCDSHYLDHRGLIFRGLALEAPKGMYETKSEYI